MDELGAAIIIDTKRVLLLNNIKSGFSRIEPPGGKRRDESIEDCVRRETKEELGVEISVTGKLGDYLTETPEGNFNVGMYLSSIRKGTPRIREPDKHKGFGWYTLQDLIGLKNKGLLVPNMCLAISDLERYLI